MKIEINWNTLDDKDWWFDVGICFQKTELYHYKYVFAIGLGISTIYIRFIKQ